MKNQTCTIAAYRAAKALGLSSGIIDLAGLVSPIAEDRDMAVTEIALCIDRETGLYGLVSAVETTLAYLSNANTAEPYDVATACIKALKAAGVEPPDIATICAGAASLVRLPVRAATPEAAAAAERLQDRIEKDLNSLTYFEREIIRLRYGIGDSGTYTRKEVARIFKVTRERVRQVEEKAILKLRNMAAQRLIPHAEPDADGQIRPCGARLEGGEA